MLRAFQHLLPAFRVASQDILERVPGARLAFVGDGPAREELKQYFAGTPTVFMGALAGACAVSGAPTAIGCGAFHPGLQLSEPCSDLQLNRSMKRTVHF